MRRPHFDDSGFNPLYPHSAQLAQGLDHELTMADIAAHHRANRARARERILRGTSIGHHSFDSADSYTGSPTPYHRAIGLHAIGRRNQAS